MAMFSGWDMWDYKVAENLDKGLKLRGYGVLLFYLIL